MAKLTKLPSKKYLEENNWFYSKALFIEEKENVYRHKFPVYKYKNGTNVILEGEFILYSESGNVNVNVYNRNSGDLYAPFYFYEYGDFTPILDVVHRNINKEAAKLGIERDVDDYNW
ncbi:MAG: hypothetical protein J6W64_02445 [Bacilli bacterium]|nr:hypothetical protein [Bacilli bacterium]